MRMHALSGGRLRMRRSVFFPDAPREDTIELPVSAFLLRHRQGNVLFDSGCHPSIADDANARWGGLAKLMVPMSTPGDNVIEGLRELDLSPQDIDLVITSHFHPDHCGCNEFFDRATVLCHREELAAAQAPGSEKQGYVRADWDRAKKFDEIGEQHDIFDDSRIVVIPLPGHTPGTVGALVNLYRSGSYLLASDALSMREILDREATPRNIWDASLFAKSLQDIRDIERRGAAIICGHDAEQWAMLKKGADAYD